MIDRLIDKIDRLDNPSVAGLDPTYEMIPGKIKKKHLEMHGKTPKAVAEMFIEFNKGLIDNLYDVVPAVKPQIAMYEKYGIEGIRAYLETINYAKSKYLIVIGDIKRGDISTTASAYAAHLSGVDIEGEKYDLWQEDAVTLSPYMGFDGIEPFIQPCVELDKGVFILVKTSNPSSEDLQDVAVHQSLELVSDLNTFKDVFMRMTMPRLYEVTAFLVRGWGKLAMGRKGYSKIGAVVGATQKEQGEQLRKIMPETFFLVPGYGAQGASGDDIRRFFDKEGRGCIVNSSRGIIAAYKNNPRYSEDNFGDAARVAALDMRDDIKGGKKRR